MIEPGTSKFLGKAFLMEAPIPAMAVVTRDEVRPHHVPELTLFDEFCDGVFGLLDFEVEF